MLSWLPSTIPFRYLQHFELDVICINTVTQKKKTFENDYFIHHFNIVKVEVSVYNSTILWPECESLFNDLVFSDYFCNCVLFNITELFLQMCFICTFNIKTFQMFDR